MAITFAHLACGARPLTHRNLPFRQASHFVEAESVHPSGTWGECATYDDQLANPWSLPTGVPVLNGGQRSFRRCELSNADQVVSVELP